MTWWVWERERIVATITEEGYNKGVLFGLKRAWPPFGRCGHDKTKADEEIGAAIEEETGTGGAIKGEAVGGWEEESISEGKRKWLN